jgi:hypothetical protein
VPTDFKELQMIVNISLWCAQFFGERDRKLINQTSSTDKPKNKENTGP